MALWWNGRHKGFIVRVFLKNNKKEEDVAGKWDKEIIRLFHDGLGAREIAQRLKIKHHATVSKRLIKLDLKRPLGSNNTDTNDISNGIQFKIFKERLNKAAEDYLKFLCRLCNYKFLVPDEEEPFDLMVNFGEGYKKVQIKSSYCESPSGNYCFKLDKTRNNSTSSKCTKYNNNEVDYFFLMDIKYNCWLIPFGEIKNQSDLTPERRFPSCKINLGT